jgi:D-inositol-3-phosphate glycosyltransferase
MTTPHEASAVVTTPVEEGGDRRNFRVAGSGISSSSSGQRVPVASVPRIALLTAGWDKPYALGLASSLMSRGEVFDFIGGDGVDSPELHGNPQVNFLNFRSEGAGVGLWKKITRVLVYYVRLICYAATSRPALFHILWNNKFEFFDRTLLMLYYKLLGKKIVFTAHNVNAGIRDGKDSFLNRLSLKIQYLLSHHILVHTQIMKAELISAFAVSPDKVSVIPFGINNTVSNTALTRAEARRKIGLASEEEVMLFFGNIAPYKGLEYLVAAFIERSKKCSRQRLVIAGRTKGCDDYWNGIQKMISSSGVGKLVTQRIEYIPDEETEVYFKAADVLVLPYAHIFQSGVLFLGYSFGLPVIVADVGSLKDEVVEGRTGFVCPPKDPVAMANVIDKYFSSDLFRNLENRRTEIREYANERYSWAKVASITADIYSRLLEKKHPRTESHGACCAPRLPGKANRDASIN